MLHTCQERCQLRRLREAGQVEFEEAEAGILVHLNEKLYAVIDQNAAHQHAMVEPELQRQRATWQRRRPTAAQLQGGRRGHEDGRDLGKVRLNGPWAASGIQRFFLVAPQCPEDAVWPALAEQVVALTREVLETFKLDASRCYVTGLSMGGFGAWAAASLAPTLYTALVAVCGGFTRPLPRDTSLNAMLQLAKVAPKEEDLEKLRELPVWLFHGLKDKIVDPDGSLLLYEALGGKARGRAKLKLTKYEDLGHTVWTSAYKTSELFPWLLRQRRGKPGGAKASADPVAAPHGASEDGAASAGSAELPAKLLQLLERGPEAQEKANSNSHAKESLGCGFQLAQDEEWDEWDELQPQDLDVYAAATAPHRADERSEAEKDLEKECDRIMWRRGADVEVKVLDYSAIEWQQIIQIIGLFMLPLHPVCAMTGDGKRDVKQGIMKLNPTVHPITRITDVNTLYDYLEEALHVVRGLGMQNTVFIPAIYQNTTDIQLAESISPHLRPIDIANRLLGTVRLRQVRVNLQENCQVLPLFEQYTVSCYPNYAPGTGSTTAFGPQQRFTYSEDVSGIDYEGSLGAYTPHGFMQLLPSNATQASQQIQQLRIDGFLDAATRAFFAEFNIWNSNVGLYAVVNFVVEFGASGGTAQEIEITTMTERVLTVGGLGTGMDWFAFVLLILVMVFVVQFIIEEVQELYQSWRTYFFDAWNLLDWV
ncbi:Polycystin-2 (Curly up) (Cup) (Polycystic kidney disease 2 protein homolog) (Transient receptor potential cation channel subfamily P member 2) [Durusdinium trenchii]|uniref:Polycystin-2 (Curly up) (Cup) (Polycystic kidney disease 2 protein homolog) (Transient receptor potential cation channel subfamily P member 2) n=1 Tax=Durusdinium trenchii TaxID=1381693 RepID=A0ABP0MAN8_9DINO